MSGDALSLEKINVRISLDSVTVWILHYLSTNHVSLCAFRTVLLTPVSTDRRSGEEPRDAPSRGVGGRGAFHAGAGVCKFPE